MLQQLDVVWERKKLAECVQQRPFVWLPYHYSGNSTSVNAELLAWEPPENLAQRMSCPGEFMEAKLQQAHRTLSHCMWQMCWSQNCTSRTSDVHFNSRVPMAAPGDRSLPSERTWTYVGCWLLVMVSQMDSWGHESRQRASVHLLRFCGLCPKLFNTRQAVPQSKKEVEQMVRTVKDLLHKAEGLSMSSLVYRDTPEVIRFSPAQLLIGRWLWTCLPSLAEHSVLALPSH